VEVMRLALGGAGESVSVRLSKTGLKLCCG